MQTTGQITIPEGFFPPPGVPFKTQKQLVLAMSLADNGIVELQVLMSDGSFYKYQGLGNANPECYRLAPPKPRTAGPFESNNEIGNDAPEAFTKAVEQAHKNGFKRTRIKLTATAEEIL